MSHRPRHLLRWTLGAIAIAAVLAVGGPYVYINLVAEKAPAALAAATSTAVVPVTGTVAGTWQAGQGSEAGYRVDEVLNGQNATAVGRTTAVTGNLTATSTKVTQAKVTVDLTKVTSDQSRRDDQFQGRIMDTSQYPTASFTLTDPIDLGRLATAAGTRTVEAHGALAMHGATKNVTVKLTVVRSGATLSASGQVPVTFADYGIDNPSFGFVSTEDHGTIEILLHLTKA
jgi:polyisoprenoid-binding protein YceI